MPLCKYIRYNMTIVGLQVTARAYKRELFRRFKWWDDIEDHITWYLGT